MGTKPINGAEARRQMERFAPYIIAAAGASLGLLILQSDLIAVIADAVGYTAVRREWFAAPTTWRLAVMALVSAAAVAAGPRLETWSWRRCLAAYGLWASAAMIWTLILHRTPGISVDFVIALAVPAAVQAVVFLRQINNHGRATFVKDMTIRHKNVLIQSVIENTHEGVFVADFEGRIIYANRTGLEMFELREEEVIGKSVDVLSPSLSQGRIGREISHYLGMAKSEGGQIGPIETSGARRDGGSFSLHLVVGVARFASSNSSYERRANDRWLYICNITNISARRKMVEAQHLALEHQVIANRAKSEFLANMSHELRTPLNAVIGFSEMLSGRYFGELNEKQTGYVQFIHSSATHLLKLINDILDISKIEAGHTDLQEEVVDVREAINACIALVKHRAIQSKISVTTNEQTDRRYLWCDERRLKQVLLNLLSNAVKFTPSSGSVEVVTEIDGEGGLAISVVDTGVGIAPRDIATALAPFGQVDSGLNRKFEGTGLGLPLSKSLMEAHRGMLTLSSSLGVGTTVTCRFPGFRIRSSADDAPDIANPKTESGQTALPSAMRAVLETLSVRQAGPNDVAAETPSSAVGPRRMRGFGKRLKRAATGKKSAG